MVRQVHENLTAFGILENRSRGTGMTHPLVPTVLAGGMNRSVPFRPEGALPLGGGRRSEVVRDNEYHIAAPPVAPSGPPRGTNFHDGRIQHRCLRLRRQRRYTFRQKIQSSRGPRMNLTPLRCSHIFCFVCCGRGRVPPPSQTRYSQSLSRRSRRVELRSSLTYEDFTGFDQLAAIALYTKPLRFAVASVAG